MSRTKRKTYMDDWSAEWRKDYVARHFNFFHSNKPLEKDAAFNGRDGHHNSDGLHEPNHRKPKGYDNWETIGTRTAKNRRWVKRTTSRIIRNRGKDEIEKAIIE